MAEEPGVIDHVTGFIADISGAGGVIGLIHNQACEKRLARHNYPASRLEPESSLRWLTELLVRMHRYMRVSFMGLGLYFT